MARIAILTASDRASLGERVDASGAAIAERARAAGHAVVASQVIGDDRDLIARLLARWCDEGVADVVVTTGGTGLAPRDVTPEATRAIAEREVPWLPLALALEGLKKTPYAVLSRGVAVIRGRTLVVNLPGNPRAVQEGMDVLVPLLDHIADVLAGPFEHESAADSGHRA